MKAIVGSLMATGLSIFLCTVSFAQTSCGTLIEESGEPGHGYVGELISYRFCPEPRWESVHFTVLSLPPGIQVFNYREGNSCLEVTGSPTTPGTYSFSIAATSDSGCSDTLTFSRTFICLPPLDFHTLVPWPDQIARAKVGQPYSQSFEAVGNGYELDPSRIRFETSGYLPPELTLTSDGFTATLSGTPVDFNFYQFTINVYLGSCLLVSSNYALNVEPATCLNLVTITGELGIGFVGELVLVSIRPEAPLYWENIQYTILSLPQGVHVHNYGPGEPVITVAGSIIQPGANVFSVAASSSNGCSDTLTITKTYVCAPEQDYHVLNPWPEYLEQAKVGQPYSTVFGTSSGPGAETDFSLFRFERTAGTLPPALTLTSDGKLSGTPQTPGDYPFTISAYIASCFYVKSNYTLHVAPAPVKTLYIYSLCSESDQVRNWRIFNQNQANVQVTWETLYYTSYKGSLTVIPGDNFFTTPNVGGPNTIRITWPDGNGNTKSIVQPSINTRCAPPACVVASSVDFYHQGRQKDGNRVAAEFSNPSTTLGEPDDNDAPNGGRQSFSLGFDGFIILQLNGKLADQVGNDIAVHEYSANNPSFAQYPERAEVFASQNGIQWVSLGVTSPSTDCSQKLDTEFDLAGKLPWCLYIKVLDVTYRHARILNTTTCAATSVFAFNNASNGFDLDGVTCVAPTGNSNARQNTVAGLFGQEAMPHTVLYPNPTRDLLVIDLSQAQEFVFPERGEIEVSIIDMNGSPVYKNMHQLDEAWTTKCDVNHLQSGLFIAKINAGAIALYYKFVKY